LPVALLHSLHFVALGLLYVASLALLVLSAFRRSRSNFVCASSLASYFVALDLSFFVSLA
jgi:hypothetical protein